MVRRLSLEGRLLEDYEYPVALTVEVTKQGVTLSKLRYLKTIGQIINETIRCPSIEVYCHVSKHVDPHIEKGHARPMGIDWIFCFDPDKKLFRETVKSLRKGEVYINTSNPMTKETAKRLLNKVETHSNLSYKRLNPFEQGLILEPYCRVAFERAGSGKKRTVLQNVEVVDRESGLYVHSQGDDVLYYPRPSPTVEIDILVITEIGSVKAILDGLNGYGFWRDRAAENLQTGDNHHRSGGRGQRSR